MQEEPRENHHEQEYEHGALPAWLGTPAPWAAALAILALLAFGVAIGSLGGAEEPTVLLASSPSRSATGSGASTPPAAAGAAEPNAGEGAEGEPEEEGQEEEPEEEAPQEAEEEEKGSEEKPRQQEERSGEEGNGGSSGASGAGGNGERQRTAPTDGRPPIKHVFLIVLADSGYAESFGAEAKSPYLAKTLRGQGELIESYYGVASGELANEIALISGQGPTPQTAADCPVYEDLAPGTSGKEGQALGAGCVYPHSTLTIGDQLTAAGETWKAYVQGVQEGGTAGCRHPELTSAPAGDPNAAPSSATPYVSWRDPFIYFHSLIDTPSSCAEHLGDMHTLTTDLKSAAKTPTLSYISPDPCDDGSPQPCAAGAPAGSADAEAFLKETVSEIESSKAYREGGLIAITSDQAPQSGPHADSRGCCIAIAYPNLANVPLTSTASTGTGHVAESSTAGPVAPAAFPSPEKTETTTTTGTASTTSALGAQSDGGGQVGLLLISRYVKPGSVEATGNYDHYSLLASIESLFKLKALGYAASPGLLTFGRGVWNAG